VVPYGETLLAGVGLRTTDLKYESSEDANNPRQRFTGKERDAETGLDFFGARYFSGAQGRFTTVDPIQYSKQRLLDPQEWNMYAYARGNPLVIMDPTGAYNTACQSKDITKCSAQEQAFEARRQRDLQSKDKRVRNAAKAYGGFNDGNNVNVKFTDKGDLSRVRQDRDNKGHLKDSFTVTIVNAGVGTNVQVHEGSHLEDMLAAQNGARPLTQYESEIKAYLTQAATLVDEAAENFNSMKVETRGVSMTLYEPIMPYIDRGNSESIKEFLAANPAYLLSANNPGKPVYAKPKP
jgi:RHS repeat-associated protein